MERAITGSVVELVLGMVPEVVEERRSLLLRHGNDVADTVLVNQVYGGLPQAKVLVSGIPGRRHKVDPGTGLHIAGRPMANFVGDPFAVNAIRVLTALPFDGPGDDSVVRRLAADLETRYAEARALLFGEWRPIFLGLLDAVCADRSIHPLNATLSIVGTLQTYSRIEQKLRRGDVNITFEESLWDTVALQGVLPAIVGAVYQKLYGDGKILDDPVSGVPYARAFAHYLRVPPRQLDQAERVFDIILYLMMYHGIGNVSTLCGVLASSSLTNPWGAFLAMGAGLRGLNHGGAAEMGIHQLFELRHHRGLDAEEDVLEREAVGRLRAGLPAWCCGHRLIRNGDPREKAQAEMIRREFPVSQLFALATRWYKVLCPAVGRETSAKYTDNNVDSLTGVSLHELGLITDSKHEAFATAVFLVARWVGCGAEVFWKSVGEKKGTPVFRAALLRPSEIALS